MPRSFFKKFGKVSSAIILITILAFWYTSVEGADNPLADIISDRERLNSEINALKTENERLRQEKQGTDEDLIKAKRDIGDLKAESDRSRTSATSQQQELQSLRKQLSDLANLQRSSEEERAKLVIGINEKQKAIDDLQARLSALSVQPSISSISNSEAESNSGYSGAPSGGPDEILLRIYPDTDYPGNDIGSARAQSSSDCADICLGNRSCRAFTYVARQKICYLKNRVSYPKRFVGAVSGGKD
jgi:hypothetical protein